MVGAIILSVICILSQPRFELPVEEGASSAASVGWPEGESASLPDLRPGETADDRIENTSPVIETELLRTKYGFLPARGNSYRLTVSESGEYRVRADSAILRPYLIVRGGSGEVLAEDDFTHLQFLPEVVLQLDAGEVYRVEVASIYGDPGPYRVAVDRPTRPDEDLPAAALGYAESALAKVEEAQPDPSPALGIALHRLTFLLQQSGQLDPAIKVARRALAVREEVLGNHPDTATSAMMLGRQYQAKRSWAKALPCFERALAIKEVIYGSTHIEVADVLAKIALAQYYLRDYDAGRAVLEREIKVRDAVLDPDDLSIAMPLNSLGLVCKKLGDHESARRLYERAIRVRESHVGPEHPSLGTSLRNLGLLLEGRGEYAAAQVIFERLVRIDEKALDPEDPKLASSLECLASTLMYLSDYAAARQLVERVLRIHEKAFGPDHPKTAFSANLLGRILDSQGDKAGARLSYERAVRIREKTLGPDHFITAMSMSNLAGVLHSLGDHGTARPTASFSPKDCRRCGSKYRRKAVASRWSCARKRRPSRDFCPACSRDSSSRAQTRPT
ncbi:MAG: hypothetical protein DHS20C21_19140 [Gemmatimonadota bacterium]|nr:MAG: hypothetical protein DHS20C21_19140 [Gemmatimonadota bacterium]